jgi:hypothetical protein
MLKQFLLKLQSLRQSHNLPIKPTLRLIPATGRHKQPPLQRSRSPSAGGPGDQRQWLLAGLEMHVLLEFVGRTVAARLEDWGSGQSFWQGVEDQGRQGAPDLGALALLLGEQEIRLNVELHG